MRYLDAGLIVLSESNVLKTPSMVQRDWQRTLESAGFLPCLPTKVAKELGPVVSLRKSDFPKIAPLTRAYRGRADMTSKGKTLRALIDVVALGIGRNETTLTFIYLAPLDPSVATRLEANLAVPVLTRMAASK